MTVLRRSMFVKEAEPVADKLRLYAEDEADFVQSAVSRLNALNGGDDEEVQHILGHLDSTVSRLRKLVQAL